MAARLKGMSQAKYQRDGDPRTSGPGFGVSIHPDELDKPFGWRKPRRVFVNSMSDLFHEEVPDEFIARVWAVMAATPQHTFQILTKRHGRMRSLLSSEKFTDEIFFSIDQGERWPLPNVHLGVSVEDQKRAELRIPALLDTPAAVRFISAEPLLGAVDVKPYVSHQCDCIGDHHSRLSEYGPRLDWLIVGGESGGGARPMHLDWVRSILRQCRHAGVPVFVKQLGSAFLPGKGGDPAYWPEDLRVREFPGGAR